MKFSNLVRAMSPFGMSSSTNGQNRSTSRGRTRNMSVSDIEQQQQQQPLSSSSMNEQTEQDHPIRSFSPSNRQQQSIKSPTSFEKSSSSLLQYNLENVNLEAALMEFYQKFYPEKLNVVTEIVRRYYGKEQILLNELANRYHQNFHEMQTFLDRNRIKKSISHTNLNQNQDLKKDEKRFVKHGYAKVSPVRYDDSQMRSQQQQNSHHHHHQQQQAYNGGDPGYQGLVWDAVPAYGPGTVNDDRWSHHGGGHHQLLMSGEGEYVMSPPSEPPSDEEGGENPYWKDERRYSVLSDDGGYDLYGAAGYNGASGVYGDGGQWDIPRNTSRRDDLGGPPLSSSNRLEKSAATIAATRDAANAARVAAREASNSHELNSSPSHVKLLSDKSVGPNTSPLSNMLRSSGRNTQNTLTSQVSEISPSRESAASYDGSGGESAGSLPYHRFNWDLSPQVNVPAALVLLYRRHNPTKAPNLDALRSKPASELRILLQKLCRRHGLTEDGMARLLQEGTRLGLKGAKMEPVALLETASAAIRRPPPPPSLSLNQPGNANMTGNLSASQLTAMLAASQSSSNDSPAAAMAASVAADRAAAAAAQSAALAAAKDEISSLRAALVEAKDEISSLHASMTAAKDEILMAKDEAMASSSTLNSRESENQRLRGELEALRNHVAELRHDSNHLRRLLSENSAALSAAQQEAAEHRQLAKAATAAAKDANGAAAAATAAAVAAKERAETIRRERQSTKGVQVDDTTSRDEIARLSSRLQATEEQRRVLEVDTDRRLATSERLERLLATSERRVSVLEADRRDLLALIEVLSSAPMHPRHVLDAYLARLARALPVTAALREQLLDTRGARVAERVDLLLQWKRDREPHTGNTGNGLSSSRGLFVDMLAEDTENQEELLEEEDFCTANILGNAPASFTKKDPEKELLLDEELESRCSPTELAMYRAIAGSGRTAPVPRPGTPNPFGTRGFQSSGGKNTSSRTNKSRFDKSTSNDDRGSSSAGRKGLCSPSKDELLASQYDLARQHNDAERTQSRLQMKMHDQNLRLQQMEMSATVSDTKSRTDGRSVLAKSGTIDESTVDDWVECYDPKTRRRYFHSATLRKSTWRRPTSGVVSPKENTNVSSERLSMSPKRTSPLRASTKHSSPLSSSTGRGGLTAKELASWKAATGAESPKNSTIDRDSPVAKKTTNALANTASSKAKRASSTTRRPSARVVETSATSSWVMAIDASSGRRYWHNKETKQSTWRKPADWS